MRYRLNLLAAASMFLIALPATATSWTTRDRTIVLNDTGTGLNRDAKKLLIAIGESERQEDITDIMEKRACERKKRKEREECERKRRERARERTEQRRKREEQEQERECMGKFVPILKRVFEGEQHEYKSKIQEFENVDLTLEKLNEKCKRKRLLKLGLKKVLGNKRKRKSTRNKLIQLGSEYSNLGKLMDAEIAYRKALLIDSDEIAHNKLGNVFYKQGKLTKAVNEFRKALKHNKKYADAFKNLGQVLLAKGDFDEAIASFEKAKNIFNKEDKLEEVKQVEKFLQKSLKAKAEHLIKVDKAKADSFGEQGNQQFKDNQFKAAVESWQQALIRYRNIGNPQGESTSLNNLGKYYHLLGQYQQTIESYQQSLKIAQQIGDRARKADALVGLGTAYNSIGQYHKAINFFEESLVIARDTNDSKKETDSLIGLGNSYYSLEQYQGAINFYKKSLGIAYLTKDRRQMNTSLNALSNAYIKLKQYQQAIEYQQHSLAIERNIQNRLGESIALNNLGEAYAYQENNQQAIKFYEQSLVIAQQIGYKAGEGKTLNNIASLLAKQKQPKLAIVFYKQSVSTYEQIRQQLRTLPKQQQESYTKTVASTYRDLANLLISQDRILEAQQVLDLLKVQELKDYLSQVRGSNEKLVILKPEEEILKKYNRLQTSAIAIGQELTKLRKIPESNRTTQQKLRISKLVKLQAELNKQFNEFSSRKDIVAQLDQLSRQAQKMAVDLSDLDGLRDDLKRLNAVMLYPLILEDRLELIITTPDSPPLRRTVQVKRSELNQVITEFRQALQNPGSDAKTPAKKLYSWLIKPLENDLKQAKAKTIIYAPDSQLRYIPLAALHDGKQWLVQRLNINNITAKSLTDFTAKPQPQPRVLAGAFVNGNYNIQVIGKNYPFRGLTYAGKEVENLTKLLPKTTKLIDKEFSKDDTTVKMNEYNIVHLATHAAFVPGDASKSFILFGSGETANLKEIGNWTLNNVDLVVLSACETGIGGKFGNGEEILGLGYQFQSRGVRATIASLWQVSDGGTQVLMNGFYNALKQQKITKAEALRQAQIALITNDYSAVGGKRGGLFVEGDGSKKPNATNSKLEHPYYWAPFILIGNGL
jgi:CHAT domain-containing protein/Tfp pilus assembly protein PilF